MRNPALEPLDVLVGEWALTLTDAWFLVSRDGHQHGRATARWLGGAFIELEAEMEGERMWHFVLGRSDANEQLVALYRDPRTLRRTRRNRRKVRRRSAMEQRAGSSGTSD